MVLRQAKNWGTAERICREADQKWVSFWKIDWRFSQITAVKLICS